MSCVWIWLEFVGQILLSESYCTLWAKENAVPGTGRAIVGRHTLKSPVGSTKKFCLQYDNIGKPLNISNYGIKLSD